MSRTNTLTHRAHPGAERETLSTSAIPARVSRVANPGAAATLSFGSTLFILSFYNVRVRGISHPNVVLGMALGAGGLTQFMAGMWSFPRGDVFSATVFSSYGAFWMSYATIYIPSSGVLAAYSSADEFSSAFGIYLITWFMVTVFFLPAVIKKHVALSHTAFLSGLAVTLLLLALAQFDAAHSLAIVRTGAIFGIIASLITFYAGMSELLAEEEDALFHLPLGASSGF
ncbi:FUN34 transmembrane protein [Mycena vulgaris]|nr:FUN34 transmembrane protein [Mycena vulgaris]